MSVQSRSGGGDGTHTSGYEESQSPNCASVLVIVKEEKVKLETNMTIKIEVIFTFNVKWNYKRVILKMFYNNK